MHARNIRDAQKLAAMLTPSWPAISARIAASGVPVCEVAAAPLKVKLKTIESEMSDARDEHAVLSREADKARAAYAASSDNDPTSRVFKAAQAALEARDESKAKIDALTQAQIGTLKLLGQDARGGRGGNGPRSGDVPAGDGWRHVAGAIDLEHGVDRVRVSLGSLLPPAPMATIGGVTVTPSSGLTFPALPQPFVQEPLDMRGLSGVFPSEQIERDDAAIQDFRSTSRETEGTVERDPLAVTEKAKLALGIELAVDPMMQFAIFIDEIPNKILDYVESFAEVLQNELSKQLVKALDAHAVAQVLNAAPPVGIKGADLISQIRYGVKMARAQGCSPTVIALSPDDAEELDLSTTGTQKVLVFPTRTTGTSSPIWDLSVREVPGLEAPVIMDPAVLGKLFLGQAVMRIDELTGLSTNQCRVLVEFEALLNVRSKLGAFVLEAGE